MKVSKTLYLIPLQESLHFQNNIPNYPHEVMENKNEILSLISEIKAKMNILEKLVTESSKKQKISLRPEKPSKGTFIPENPFEESERKFSALAILPEKPLSVLRPIIRLDQSSFSDTTWKNAVKYLRTTEFDQFNNIFPTDRKDNVVKAIIYKGADPKKVYELFCLGLISQIFLQNDIDELIQFPENFKEAVLDFMQKVGKDNIVTLNITSSIPDWTTNDMVLPYHVIELNTKKNLPGVISSKVLEDEKMLFQYSLEGIYQITRIMQKLKTKDKIKVNYCTSRILIHSKFNQPKKKDYELVQKFAKRIERILDELNPEIQDGYRQWITEEEELLKTELCSTADPCTTTSMEEDLFMK